MKKIIVSILSIAFIAIVIISCATSDVSKDKGGGQLWGENCVRCHNLPSPDTFSDVQWDVAVLHMKMRANLTDDEAKKIAEFLKMAN